MGTKHNRISQSLDRLQSGKKQASIKHVDLIEWQQQELDFKISNNSVHYAVRQEIKLSCSSLVQPGEEAQTTQPIPN